MGNYLRRIHKTIFLKFGGRKPLQPPLSSDKGGGGPPDLVALGIKCSASEINSLLEA